MTERQSFQLNKINKRIESQNEVKSFFSRNYKRITIIAFFASATFVTLGFINDPKRLQNPDTFDYSEMLYFFITGFIALLIIAFFGHIMFYLQSTYIIKQLEKEECQILHTIEQDNRDFERYETFNEIEK